MKDMDRIFENHEAVYERINKNMETLKWRNPKNTFYSIYYVRWGGTLMVFGDCYSAIYQWCPDDNIVTLDWIGSRTNLDYFKDKCRAAPLDGLYQWNETAARKKIDNVIKEREEDDWDYDDDITLSEIRARFEEASGRQFMAVEEDWAMWLNEHGQEVFGDEYYFDDRITRPGKALNPCIHLHHEGLKRAMAQISVRHGLDQSPSGPGQLHP